MVSYPGDDTTIEWREVCFAYVPAARLTWLCLASLCLFFPLPTLAQEVIEPIVNPAANPVAPFERPPDEMRIRIAWGGGEHVAWRCQIKLDEGAKEGAFSAPQCLGREADAWATLVTLGNAIRIDPRRPQSYQALDVTIRASLASNLIVEMEGHTTRDGPRTFTVPLTQLRDGSFNLPMDAVGNRLLVRRVPGDRLRVSMSRDHLVFAPGEDWRLNVQPWLISRDGFNPSSLQARIVPARSEQVLWRSEEAPLVRDEIGDWRGLDLAIPVPKREGVYDLVLRATQPRGISLLPSDNSQQERRVQFIVVDPSLPAVTAAADGGEWRETLSFDPSQARWWEKLARLPSLPQLSLSPMRMRGEGNARVGRWGDRSASVLAAKQWQAYPLPILRPGTPHRIEVECLGDATEGTPRALGVSVIEPTSGESQGSQRVVSLDAAKVSAGKAELVFWPQTRSTKLLLTNPGEDDEVAFGRIRLLEGPARLPPSTERITDHGFRKVLAHCDDPKFHRAFFASHALDTEADRELTDWITFQEGGQRMVDYLRHVGLGGLSLTCVAQGGSLAPLQTIAGIPQHDTGTYFSSGQDAYPKDVLEMLLRMFDREELQLQVGVQFTAPLVNLESYRAANNAMGVELTNQFDQPYRQMTLESETAYYNPLDPRVQEAMLQVIREITTRYSRHESFAGIRIDLSSAGFTHLPGLEWGCDRQKLALFVRDMAGELDPEVRENLQPAQLLEGPLQPLWIAWRQRRLTNLYAAAAAEVRRLRPDARLTLHVAPLVDSGAIASASQPGSSSQTTLEQALARAGLDLKTLANVDGLDVLRPYHDSPLSTLAERGKSLVFSKSPLWDQLQKDASQHGATPTDSPQNVPQPAAAVTYRSRRRTVGLDNQSLFGVPSTELQLQPRLTLDDRVYRRSLNHALATSDVRLLTIGGDILVPNRNADLAAWLDVYRRLPSQPFKRFQAPTATNEGKGPIGEGHPVTVATLSIAGRTYLYAVNESAWPVETVVVCSATNCRFTDLGRSSDGAWERLENGWQWRGRLRPYELAAQVLTDPEAKVVRVQTRIPDGVVPALQRRLANATSHLNTIKEPVPYNRLANQGFDEVPPAVEVPGWQWAREPGLNVTRDDRVSYNGSASLRMESSQPVTWVRSNPVPVPRTGRLALQAMLRFDPGAASQSTVPLRLALEGTYQGQPYYRFAEVTPPRAPARTEEVVAGALPPKPGAPQATATPQPPAEWSPFRLQVNDLPIDGLEDLRVRFDLMGAGRVWIDDVRLYDLSLTPDEQLEVSKLIGLADYQLRSGRPADCDATLDRYWPLFLAESVPGAEIEATTPVPVVTPESTPVPEESAVPIGRPTNRPRLPRSGILKRIRRALPR